MKVFLCLFLFAFPFLGMADAYACVGAPLSPREVRAMQRETLRRILNYNNAAPNSVIATDFSRLQMSRGIRGSCTAVRAYGTVRVAYRRGCTGTYRVQIVTGANRILNENRISGVESCRGRIGR